MLNTFERSLRSGPFTILENLLQTFVYSKVSGYQFRRKSILDFLALDVTLDIEILLSYQISNKELYTIIICLNCRTALNRCKLCLEPPWENGSIIIGVCLRFMPTQSNQHQRNLWLQCSSDRPIFYSFIWLLTIATVIHTSSVLCILLTYLKY